MDLKNKTVILTGAARIGQEVAKELKTRGANLVLTYLKSAEETGNLGEAVQADLALEKDVKKVVDFAKEKFGRVDVLVHMAAIYKVSPWNALSEKDWDQNMNIIAKSAFLLGKYAADEMMKNEVASAVSYGVPRGKIIFFSDWSVITRPYKDYLAYNAAKSAVVGLTKSFAKELAPDILVNAIAPGPILRPPDLSDQDNQEVMAHTPLQRWGGAEEIAKGVMYLLDADFVTGQVLTIDGGRTIA